MQNKKRKKKYTLEQRGRMGGLARARRLSKRIQSDIGTHAVRVRWAKAKGLPPPPRYGEPPFPTAAA